MGSGARAGFLREQVWAGGRWLGRVVLGDGGVGCGARPRHLDGGSGMEKDNFGAPGSHRPVEGRHGHECRGGEQHACRIGGLRTAREVRGMTWGGEGWRRGGVLYDRLYHDRRGGGGPGMFLRLLDLMQQLRTADRQDRVFKEGVELVRRLESLVR